MGISLAAAIIGGIIVFATHGTIVLSFWPSLDVYAAGWVMMLMGIFAFIGFLLVAANQRYHDDD